MNETEKYWLAKAMQEKGGSFIRALGTCLLFADAPHTERLVQAFPEYVKEYSEIAWSMLKAHLEEGKN